MEISEKILQELGVKKSLAAEYATPLTNQLNQHGIDTSLRCAHFLGQVLHESSLLSRLSENLNYSQDGLRKIFSKYFNEQEATAYAKQPERIANRVYANRIGNGDEASGDGWRYRGRGLIQLTGKANYQKFSDWIGDDVVAEPDKVADIYPVECAVFFWEQNNLNRLADQDDVKGMTKRITGGTTGLKERTQFTERAKTLLGAGASSIFAAEENTTAASLDTLLAQQPQLQTCQDLINYFYKASDGTFAGATSEAQRLGLDMQALLNNRTTSVTDLGGEGRVMLS